MSEDIETDIEAPEADARPDPRSQLEEAARKSGWAGKDDWKGDPEQWIDAPEFILKAVGDVLPNMRKSLEDARSEVSSMKKTLKEFGEHHSKTEARAFERAMKEIQDRIDLAASLGDVAAVRAGTGELVELQKDAVAPVKGPEVNADFDAWRENNAWFGTDKALTAATIALGEEVAAEGYSGKAQIKEVDKRLREQFPNKFENPNRKLPGAVEGGGTAPRRSGKSYSDLPAEAKEICDDFVRRIPGFTRETYVKDYFA